MNHALLKNTWCNCQWLLGSTVFVLLGIKKFMTKKQSDALINAFINSSFRYCYIRHVFYKQHFFSTQCCLTFSWIELQMLLRCCLVHIHITILRHVLYLSYLCPCLDLQLFAKNIAKIAQVKKKMQPKRNINSMYIEKLHYKYLQQLPTLKLKTCAQLSH